MKIEKQLKNKCGIYKITNLITEDCYIGSSEDLECRLYCHFWDLKNNCHSRKFQSSFNKHGIKNFIYEILEFCNEDVQIEREQHYLDTLLFAQEYISSNGKDNRFILLSYNLSPTAGKTSGYKHSEETLKKMSENTILLWQTEEYREKMINNSRGTGIVCSEEKKKKIGNANRKRFEENPELRQYYKDLNADPVRKQKAREDSKRNWKNPEFRAKIINEESNRKKSEKTKSAWEDPAYNEKRLKTYRETQAKPDYISPFKKRVKIVHNITGEEIIFPSATDCKEWFYKQGTYPEIYKLWKSGNSVLNYKIFYLPKGK